MGSKLLTLNPAFANFPQGVVLTPAAFARAVVAMPSGDRLKSYTAVENVGLMMVDVGAAVPPVLADLRVREPIASGNYNRCLRRRQPAAGHRANRQDAGYLRRQPLAVVLGAVAARRRHRLEYAEGSSIDVNGDGEIAQDEVLNLAFVGGTGGVVILDVTNPDAPVILGTVAMKGTVYQMEFDADKRRLFVSGPTELPDKNWASR